jgi:hypothetical protein
VLFAHISEKRKEGLFFICYGEGTLANTSNTVFVLFAYKQEIKRNNEEINLFIL